MVLFDAYRAIEAITYVAFWSLKFHAATKEPKQIKHMNIEQWKTTSAAT